jgi:transposase
VAAVPWARHAAGHTHAFDEQVAWLATQCSKSAITELMRIAWRTVGAIITRVWADVEAVHDRFADLRRIGIDEISYKRGQRYLTVVVDHDSGRLVWAAPGREKTTLERFFDALGEERSALITHVSADGADWISAVVTRRCPSAVRCADPFHVVKWATEALDDVRRQAWNAARSQPGGRSRPDPMVARTHPSGRRRCREGAQARPLRAVEEPRAPHHPTGREARLDRQDRPEAAPGLPAQGRPPAGLPARLRRGRRGARDLDLLGPPLPHPQLRRPPAPDRHTRGPILAAIEHRLSNGRIESVNTKIRLITRVAFGFKSPDALIALAMLNLGGHRPVLPGRK